MKSRITIRDIAEKAGCHFSTVSLALRDNPKISKDKREHIQKISRALGYRPDPFLSALTAYRSENASTDKAACLAWLIISEDRDWGKDSSNYPFFYKGARSRAEERGYRIEKFWLHEEGMTPRRMSEILYHRGIVGVIIPHSDRPIRMEFDWKRFALVSLGYSVESPQIDMVASNAFRNISEILRETYLRGYRRPALVESASSLPRFENHWLGAYLTEQHYHRDIAKIDPFVFEEWSTTRFKRWLLDNQPDVVITRSRKVREGLNALGYSIPNDIGLAFHCIPPGEYSLTGTTKNAAEMAKMGVDYIIDMLHRNERGIPAIPKNHLVNGSWVEGGTLRPAPIRSSDLKSASPSADLQLAH